MDSLSAAGIYPALRQKVGDIFQPFIVLRVKLKRRLDNFCFLFVHDDLFVSHVVNIANRRNALIFASPDFLAQTTLRVFKKRIHILFALHKSDIDHKFFLWRWFKPKLRKFQRHNTLAINKVNDFSTVHRIAR